MKFPELDKIEIEKAIDKIESSDLKTISIDSLEIYLKPLFSGYRFTAPFFDKGVYLYRGRIAEKPNNIKKLIYPPSECITNYGRINEKGKSFFYGAVARSVPFFELNTKVGDKIALSTWRSNNKMHLNHIGFTEECKKNINSNRDLSEIYNFVKDTSNFGNLNNFVHNYLSSKFIQVIEEGNEFKYKLTIAIARKLLMGNLLNGILYPTIAMSANADNIVLKTDFFDNNIDFVSVEYIEIIEKNGLQYKINVLDSSTKLNNKGDFSWSGRGLQWKIKENYGELKLQYKANTFEAYDKNGNRVDPE